MRFDSTMISLAIDENGYGPALGPLVATGIAGTSDVSSGWPKDIFDSKKLFSSREKLAAVEKIALSLFKIVFKKIPSSIFDLFEKSQYKRCLQTQICWDNLPQIPMRVTISEIDRYLEYLSAFLEKYKISILSLYSQVLCVKEFNSLCRKNLKKDYINYLQFEKIILRYHRTFENIMVVSGKIGGRKNYTEFLKKNLSDWWEIKKKQENSDISEYLLRKNNATIILRFVRDIENKSFLGVLAGIYGKYIREIIVTGINRYFRTERFISGYRDQYTSEFIKKLSKKNLPYTDCILRIK